MKWVQWCQGLFQSDKCDRREGAALGRERFGFTLLEVLVSCVVFTIVTILSFSIIDHVSDAWRMQRARLSTFEGARVGFELLANRLGQATLNTYWDYDDRENPQKYIRQSELHYLQGNAIDILPEVTSSATQGVFFVAPLGLSETSGLQPLVKMLTACGFYIAFSGDPDRPTFLDSRIPKRYRYRLYQYMEVGENLAIYQSASDRSWFQEHLRASSYPMIENVIGLIIRARYPDGTGGEVSTYLYDSRATSPAAVTHQLPPTLQVTLVVMSEDSASRLEAQYGETMPPIQPPVGFFASTDRYEADLAEWQADVLDPLSINYRIFTANIPIRGAKWSSN